MSFEVGDWVKCVNPSNDLYGDIFKVNRKIYNDNMRYLIRSKEGTPYYVPEDVVKDFVLTPSPIREQTDKLLPPTVKPTDSGVKYDSGKRQWWFMWQFLPELEQVCDILEYGNKKYPAEDGSNWRKVDGAKNRYTSAAMRHWSAWLSGEKVDAETGKSHLAHMVTNLLFLMWFERNSK